MGFIDTLLTMSRDELRVLLAIAVSACALCGYVFFGLGKARGWSDRRNEIDRNNIVVESAILRDLPDGRIELAIETADRMPPLHEVLCDDHLEARAKNRLTACVPGDPLFGEGDDHYVAMERVCLLITGADTVATQSALMGRHEDYHLDRVAVLLTAARGEDGLLLARIIKANPADLERLLDPGFAERVLPVRQIHSAYLPLLQSMARHFVASRDAFRASADERDAGRTAAVWTALIRTQRTTVITEADMRRIVRAEIEAANRPAARVA